MSQQENLIEPIEAAKRLLPGDQAPPLRLARIFNRREPIEQLVFDRLSAVILWNAGCADCLRIIGDVAESGVARDVTCYGVAVMVRDIERTAEAARQGSEQAILGLEERPVGPVGLGRGSVTRDWLEASGQQGVPAAFLVDETGRVVWIGDPAEISSVLSAWAGGIWDVAAARKHWRNTVGDVAITELRTLREIFDALAMNEIDSARAIIEISETQLPSLLEDVEFNILKFEALAAEPVCVDEAVAHYAAATSRFPNNLRLHSVLGGSIVRQMGQNEAAMRIAVERLAKIETGPIHSENEAALRVHCQLLEAEAQSKLGRSAAALAAIEQATTLSNAADFPSIYLGWATSEIERVRGEALRLSGST